MTTESISKTKAEPTASTSTSTTHDINTLLNRTSVALARSQRLVDSWLPTAPTTSNISENADSTRSAALASTDDNDLQSLLAQVGRSDKAGLGYVNVNAAGAGTNGARGSESELDRLRRQMLGKKGAKVQLQNQARAQAERGGRGGGMIGLVPRGGNAVSGAPLGKRRDRESDDEGGRSVAFKSKKRVKRNVSGSGGGGGGVATAVVPTMTGTNGADGAEVSEASTTITAKVPPAKVESPEMEAAEDDDDHGDEEKTEKSSRKPTSYLDEVLSQRKKKKKKKKNKNKANADVPGAVAG